MFYVLFLNSVVSIVIMSMLDSNQPIPVVMGRSTPVPEGSWLPAWPAAGADRAPHMSLGEKLELRGVLLEERTRFWDDIYQRYYRDAVPSPIPPPRPHVEL